MKNIFKFKRKPKVKKERTLSVAREYFELIVETLIYVFFVNTFLLQSFVIPTGSMENTLLIGDHLLVNKVAYSRSINRLENMLLPQVEIKRGMIVTFKAPPSAPNDPNEDPFLWEAFLNWINKENNLDLIPYPASSKEYVKRVIGLPGDSIRIENKNVFINEKLINEPYAYFKFDGNNSINIFPPESNNDWAYTFPHRFCNSFVNTKQGKAFKIPDGYCFCMGDNRDNSYDCRFWGPVPFDYIIGKPWRIYWSYESNSDEYLTPGILYKIKDLVLTVKRFFTRTRWDRTIKVIE